MSVEFRIAMSAIPLPDELTLVSVAAPSVAALRWHAVETQFVPSSLSIFYSAKGRLRGVLHDDFNCEVVDSMEMEFIPDAVADTHLGNLALSAVLEKAPSKEAAAVFAAVSKLDPRDYTLDCQIPHARVYNNRNKLVGIWRPLGGSCARVVRDSTLLTNRTGLFMPGKRLALLPARLPKARPKQPPRGVPNTAIHHVDGLRLLFVNCSKKPVCPDFVGACLAAFESRWTIEARRVMLNSAAEKAAGEYEVWVTKLQ